MSRLLVAAVLLGCSRPVPIAPDPVAIKDAGPPPAPAPSPVASSRYFMDTSSGSTDCYDDVYCKVVSEPCPPDPQKKKHSAKWTAKLRAESPGAWCCYASTICEFPEK